jgi:arylsulfatase A-like enzyme
VLGGHRTEEGLTGAHPTIARELKELGYRTSMIGKWHLGVASGSQRSDHGFDEWFGILSGSVDYFSHINYNLWPWNVNYYPVHDLWENGREVWRNREYVTEVIADRAGELESTLFFMMSDSGPSRHPANWLDGNLEPYYGASAGELRGGKTSLRAEVPV